jgi:hypothetical protein
MAKLRVKPAATHTNGERVFTLGTTAASIAVADFFFANSDKALLMTLIINSNPTVLAF